MNNNQMLESKKRTLDYLITLLLTISISLTLLSQGSSYMINDKLIVTTVKGTEYNLTELRDSFYTKFGVRTNDDDFPKCLDFKMKAIVRSEFFGGEYTSRVFDSLNYPGLNSEEVYGLMLRELLCKGKVLSKTDLSLDRCTKYKTSYQVVIDSFFWSIYPYKTGDTIDVYIVSGVMGDSCMEGGKNASFSMIGEPRLMPGQEYLFALSDITLYNSMMLKDKGDSHRMKDIIKPNSFTLYSSGFFLEKIEKVDRYTKFLDSIYFELN